MDIACNALLLVVVLLLMGQIIPQLTTTTVSVTNEDESQPALCACFKDHQCFTNFTIKTAGEGLLNERKQMFKTHTDCPPGEILCCQPGTPITQIGCGRQSSNPFAEWIEQFNPNETYPGEFPWMVSILVNKSVEGTENLYLPNIYLCGGVIIHESIVLTAAHCLYNIHAYNNFPDDTLSVRAGVWNLLDSNEAEFIQDRNVNFSINHSDYDEFTLIYDYALLLLNKPLNLNERVGKICLPNSEEDLSQLPECFVTGWGKNNLGTDGTMSPILKKLNMPLVDFNECESKLQSTRLSQFFELDKSFICAGGNVGLDTCTGDGGSPLVCKPPGSSVFHLTGLVSWGIDCGTQIPGVYANVGKNLKWIVDTKRDLLKKL